MNIRKISKPIRILLSDDNQEHLSDFQQAFENQSIPIQLTHCPSAKKTMTYIDNTQYDIVVINYKLPDMSGLDLCKYLLEQKIYLPIILLIEPGNEKSAAQAINAGITDYLVTDTNASYLELLPIVLIRAIQRKKEQIANELTIKSLQVREAKYREAMTEAAESAKRIKGQFLANMSHEIRTPMNSIIGSIDLALMTELTQQQKELLQTARISSDSLLELINNILDIARIEADQLELNETDCNLNKFLKSIVKSLSLKAEQKGLEMSLEINPNVPSYIKTDVIRLGQILNNLVSNAIKFTEKGHIRIICEMEESEVRSQKSGVGSQKSGVRSQESEVRNQESGIRSQESEVRSQKSEVRNQESGNQIPDTRYQIPDTRYQIPDTRYQIPDTRYQIPEPTTNNQQPEFYLRFSVSDTGIGISDEQIENIFYRFTQLDNSNTRRYGGTGLGTTISKQLTEMMGGRIWVESQIEKGSTFHFTIKTKPGKPDKESECIVVRNFREKTKNRLRILLAEDNPLNQKLAMSILTMRGHEVIMASNGKVALETFDKESFDLILMDIQMPEMDGLETTRRIREKEIKTQTYTPIVALTAHATKYNRNQCMTAGMDDYISKPIQRDKLLTTIENLPINKKKDICGKKASDTSKKPDNTDVFNLNSLLAIVGGSMELVNELIRLYLKNLPKLMFGVRDAVISNNPKNLEFNAHSLKGMSLNLAARNVADKALELEKIGKSKDLSKAGIVYKELEKEVEKLKSTLLSLKIDKIGD